MWLKLRFPFWFCGQFDKRLRCPVMHDRDAERALFRFAGFGYPYAAYRLNGGVQVYGRDQLQPLRWCQAFDAVHPGGLFPFVFLRHLSDG